MSPYREPAPGVLAHCPQCETGKAHYTYAGSLCLTCERTRCRPYCDTASWVKTPIGNCRIAQGLCMVHGRPR